MKADTSVVSVRLPRFQCQIIKDQAKERGMTVTDYMKHVVLKPYIGETDDDS